MKFFKKAKRGFTLVELVVVIAVIAILAAVSVGAYFGVTESANNSRLEQETKQMYTAIQTVALGNNSNAKLDSTGLTVDSAKTFETDLEKQTGTDLTVYKGEAPVIATPTIVLKETLLENSNGSATVYKTYEYYQNEISGKKIITDVVTGKTKIDKTTVDFNSGAEIGEYVEIYFKNTLKNWDDNAHAHTFTLDPNDETKVTASNGWPGDKATVVSLVDDIYKVEINTTYEYVIFNNGKTGSENGEQQMPRVEIPTVEQLKEKPYWDGDSWEAQPVIETDYATTGLTAYFRAGEWATVNAYAYNRAGESNNPEQEQNNGWPGKPMTAVENRNDKLYSYTFDKDYYRVIFNNGNSGEGNQTTEIPFDGFSETNCYYDGTTWTTYPDDLEITPTYRTIYVKEYEWWHQQGGNSQVYQYRIEGEEKVSINNNDSEYGVPMTHVLWDDLKYVNYRSFTFETTNNEVDGFRFYRMADGNPANAVSVDISLEDLGENNLVILDGTATWFNETNYTAVTFSDYESDSSAPAPIYLKGDFNEWSESDEYVLNKNQEGNYVIENVEIAAGQEAKLHVQYSNRWYGYNTDMSSDYITSAEEGANILFNDTGIYKITLTVGETKKVIIEQTENLPEPHVHDWNTDGTCKGCKEICQHENYEDSKCIICKHVCEHESYVDNKCVECGAIYNHTHSFDPSTGMCDCGTSCSHDFSNGKCTICQYEDPKYHAEITLYVKMWADWRQANAQFQAELSGSSSKTVDLEYMEGDYYSFRIPNNTYTKVKFLRNNPDGETWNKSGEMDLTTIDSSLLIQPNTWDPWTATWTTAKYGIAGELNSWDASNLKYHFVQDQIDPSIYSIEATFESDNSKFKIQYNLGWDVSFGAKFIDEESKNHVSNESFDDNGDIKIKKSGTYIITINSGTSKITITPKN